MTLLNVIFPFLINTHALNIDLFLWLDNFQSRDQQLICDAINLILPSFLMIDRNEAKMSKIEKQEDQYWY